MSGIAGIVDLDRTPVAPTLLESVAATLDCVGPDGRRHWCGDHVALCHARLQTGMTPDEPQPCSLDGVVRITADARLDGRAELLHELRSGGRLLPKDIPDALLLLHAYQTWGEACLDHLIGDFAFAIWDGRRRRLFCARDHFGVTPFYYARTGRQLIVSNVLNVLHRHPAVSDRLDEAAVGAYLLFSCNDDPSTTAFADIRALPPAHCLTWSDEGLEIRRYWTPPEAGYTYARRPEEYVEGFRDVFRQAVEDRLDAPRAAVTLSGGLDSTSVAAVAAQACREGSAATDLVAYAGGFDWLLPDTERHYAGLVARKSGVPIRYLGSEPFLAKTRSPETWLLAPEPRFFLPPPPALEIMQRVASEGVRVVLTGLGGDAALQRVDTYWLDLLGRRSFGRFTSEVTRYVRANGRRPPLGLKTWMRRRLMQKPAAVQRAKLPALDWLNPDFVARIDLQDRMRARMMISLVDGRTGMATNAFWCNSASVGDPEFSGLPVKVRHPFFDVRLIEYLQMVPPVPWFERKRLLRDAMQDLLPEAVHTRPKAPLSANFYHAFAQQESGPLAEVEALAELPALAQYVDPDALRKALRAPDQVPSSQYLQRVVLPLSLAFWLGRRHRLRDELLGDTAGALAAPAYVSSF